MTNPQSIDGNEAIAIVKGGHGNPFGFLGPHHAGDDYVVRVFLPEATRVQVVEPKRRRVLAELERVHEAGLFVGRITAGKRCPAYRLLVDWHGESIELDDPYRFPPWLGELDIHLLAEGNHLEVYQKLGAHPTALEGVDGFAFAVWAPNACRVSLVGDFNNWDGRRHPMRLQHDCGVWEIFMPGLAAGERYQYEIKRQDGTVLPLKSDPVAFYAERSPKTASITYAAADLPWDDAAWMERRGIAGDRAAPVAIYEVHLGSWRRKPEEGNRYLTYRELADELVPYVKDLGFTHIELMPINEYPFDGSWGYQPTGLFAPTSRFGTPDDFRALISACHRAGLGVILDWVPGHFPNDAHGLGGFDGTHLYEHADPRKGVHKDWDTLIYNYGRTEIANFLLSNALYWLREFHIDGLRVDAVASMLYLDYSREAGEWEPNIHGGRENLEAVAFLKRLNELAYDRAPGAVTVAEESTAWPMVSRPTYLGGLGFGYKWNMGWMHDSLEYMKEDPINRSHHHNKMTFSLHYAFSENFVLPLSHDEVVHGKGSLLTKMPGDRWQKFANLRVYLTFMYGHPGKKLMFMGGEFAQEREWNHDFSLDWHLLSDPLHAGMQRLMRDLNRCYREVSALHARDAEPEGFEWIDGGDSTNSVLSFMRRGVGERDLAVCICNFTPVPRQNYRVGVPLLGMYREMLNSDAESYGGSNLGNNHSVEAEPVPWHGRPYSLNLTLPPLAGMILCPEKNT